MRIEGKTKTLLGTTSVDLANEWINRPGAPKGDCPADSTLGALDVASKHGWAGAFNKKLNSFVVDSILGETEKSPLVWTARVNYQRQSTACGLDLQTGDEVLFAAAAPTDRPIALIAPTTAKRKQEFTMKVVSFSTSGVSKPLDGAQVTFARVNKVSANGGIVKFVPSKDGTLVLDASDKGYIRAALARVKVTG